MILLTRNVRILGTDTDAWGGQVVVSDKTEENGVKRTGVLELDSVEIFNCSQRQTQNSALRFQSATGGHSKVLNSAVWGSRAWGFGAMFSANLHIEKTSFVGAR